MDVGKAEQENLRLFAEGLEELLDCANECQQALEAVGYSESSMQPETYLAATGVGVRRTTHRQSRDTYLPWSRMTVVSLAAGLGAFLVGFLAPETQGSSHERWIEIGTVGGFCLAVGLVFLFYWLRSRRPGSKNRVYLGMAIEDVVDGLEETSRMVKNANEWAAKQALLALTQPVGLMEAASKARATSEELQPLVARVFRDSCYGAMVRAEECVLSGRRRLAPMKSTSLLWKDLDEKLKALVMLWESPSPDWHEAGAAYATCWNDALVMLRDGEESLADHRYDRQLWIAGFAWTVVVAVVSAVVTWLVTRQ